MDAAAVGVAQKEEREQGIHEQDIFDGVILFLAAITRGLWRRVLGADDPVWSNYSHSTGLCGETLNLLLYA
jgi:hypothetical protein